MDNHYQLKDSLTSTSRTDTEFSYPLHPDKRYTPVAILDICRAAASVLQNPGGHTHKIYHLASDRFSMRELAKVGELNVYVSRFFHTQNFYRFLV